MHPLSISKTVDMKKIIIFIFVLIININNIVGQCFTAVSSSNFHSTARKTNGTYWVFGGGGGGVLGNTTGSNELTPILIPNSSTWIYLKSNRSASFAITSSGTLWATGANFFGSLGNGNATPTTTFQQIGNQSNWKVIDGDEDFTIALKTNNTLWAWGHNNYHQLGNGNTTDSYTPIQISPDADWRMIESAGNDASFALKNNGTMWGWGNNNSFILGDDNIFSYLATPTQINTDNDWRTITCGTSHALAIKTNGTLWAWGDYGFGQTGIDLNNLPAGWLGPHVPRQIGTDNNWQSLAAGAKTSMGIKTDGTLWVWGVNNVNQLGDGTNINRRFVPYQIGTDTNWASINSGFQYCIALKTDGSMWAWGDNTYGQLGNGTTDNILVPTLVNVTGCTLANETFNLENSKVQLAPNPAKEFVTISYNELTANSTITLYDLTGRSLANYNNENTTGTIDVNTASYPGGIYIVVIKENDEIISQQKLVIE